MSKCLGGFLRISSVEKLSWMRIVQRIAHTKFKLLIIMGCKLCTNSYSQSLFIVQFLLARGLYGHVVFSQQKKYEKKTNKQN